MTPLLESKDKQEKATTRSEDEDEEEDYMTMLIPDRPTGPETSLQRRERQKREGEIRGRPKSKKELEEDEYVKRETALMTSLDTSNSKGFKMMEKLGYKPGTGLGKTSSGRTEPIQLSMKEDKSGIGLENERKRKFRQEMEKSVKRTKADENQQLGYWEQMRQEREAGRAEHQFMAAQRAIEHIESSKVEEQDVSTAGEDGNGAASRPIEERPLKSIDIVWRGLIRHRRQQEAERTRRRIIRDFIDDEEDILADSTAPTGKRKKKHTLEDEDPDEEDEELDEFNTLEPQEKLRRAVEYLREKYHYCFWCKFRYPDKQMEGCPGIAEEDHE